MLVIVEPNRFNASVKVFGNDGEPIDVYEFGIDEGTSCCEEYGLTIKMDNNVLYDSAGRGVNGNHSSIPPKPESFSFDADHVSEEVVRFVASDSTSSSVDNYVKIGIQMKHKNKMVTLKVKLYNSHNGYYSHGITCTKNNTSICGTEWL